MFEKFPGSFYHLIIFIFALLLSPFLMGIINRTKAFYAGRKGQSLFQLYFDIFKLLRKGVTYSRTTTWVFKATPVFSLSSLIIALWILCSSLSGMYSFDGDVIIAFYFIAFARFATVLAALDTGSSFEGMGVSRELMLAPYSELGLFVIIITGAMLSGAFNVVSVFGANYAFHTAILMAVSLLIFLLVENCRVPADDPNTHLELTMIHEVMVLDYSGPDLAFIFWGAAIKLCIFAILISSLLLSPFAGLSVITKFFMSIFIIIIISVIIGTVESIMARFRFEKVRRMLILASVLASLILFIIMGNKI